MTIRKVILCFLIIQLGITFCLSANQTFFDILTKYSILKFNLEESIEYAINWAGEEKDNPIPHFLLINLYYLHKEYNKSYNEQVTYLNMSIADKEKVINWLSNLDKENPNNGLTLFLLGNAYAAIANSRKINKEQREMAFEKSKENFKMVLEINPGWTLNYSRLALYSSLEEGLLFSQKAIEIDPQEPDGYFSLAYNYILRKQPDKAIFYSEKSIELTQSNPYPPFYSMLGYAQFKANLFEEAIKSFKKAIELGSKNIVDYFLLGSIYLKKGLIEEAEVFSKEAINIEPGEPCVLAYLNLGEIYLKKNMFQDAQNNLSKVIELDSSGQYRKIAEELFSKAK